jgi:transposase, IS6 family
MGFCGATPSTWASREGGVALGDVGDVAEADPVIGSTYGFSAPAGYRFPREVIAVGVRWYLRYGLSYRDVEELLAERGVEVDHVTIYRWVQTFTAEFIDAARPARHAAGDRWFVDETYVKVAGRWSYLYRALDQHGQVIDVLVSRRRDAAAARSFFARALQHGLAPVEVVTDRAPVYPRVVEEAAPAARHVTERHANTAIEADHGRLKARLRPMRGLKRMHSARTIAAGHAFVQNLRRGHYAITADLRVHDRVRDAFESSLRPSERRNVPAIQHCRALPSLNATAPSEQSAVRARPRCPAGPPRLDATAPQAILTCLFASTQRR